MGLLGVKCTLVLSGQWNFPSGLWTSHTGGGWSVKFYHNSDFPSTKLYRVQKTKQNWACRRRGSCSCTSCVRPKCKPFLCSSLPSRLTSENSFCWAISWLRSWPGSQGGSHSPLTGSFHHVPTRWEGSWGLGRGSCSHLPYSNSVVFTIFRYMHSSPQSALEYFHYLKKSPPTL